MTHVAADTALDALRPLSEDPINDTKGEGPCRGDAGLPEVAQQSLAKAGLTEGKAL
jgi:hypothetical protein